MYNLIMCGTSNEHLKQAIAEGLDFRAGGIDDLDNIDATRTGALFIEQGRFLEYTDENLKNKFGLLDDSAIKKIKKFPALITPEHQGGNGSHGYLAVITEIEIRQKKIRIKFQINGGLPFVPTQHLHDHLFDFDLNKFEINRLHWAIKNIDLFKSLNGTGISVSQEAVFAQTQESEARVTAPRAQVLHQLNVLICALSENVKSAEKRANTSPTFDLVLGNDAEFIDEIRKLTNEMKKIRKLLSSGGRIGAETSLLKEALRKFVLKLSGELGTGLGKTITITISTRIALCYFAANLLGSLEPFKKDLRLRIENMFQDNDT